MNIAAILAGGSGNRAGGGIPKQFTKVCGKSVMEYTIDVFNSHPLIDSIIVVGRSDTLDIIQSIVDRCHYQKVHHIVSGGKERYESSIAALALCDSPNDVILFHDCARPLVSSRIITDCINAMESYDAATVAIPCSDTIYMSSTEGYIRSIPPRSSLMNAQTPQCFRVHTISDSYKTGLSSKDFIPTDDCSVVFNYGNDIPIKIIEGEARNIKITYKEDFELMERILKHGI